MNYYINPQTYSTAFPIPSQIVDNHLRLAKPEHILVILFLYRNISAMPSIKEICAATGIDEYDVNEALMYWEDAGILLKKDTSPVIKENEPKTVIENKKPTRSDVARRGLEDPKIRHLLGEAQFKFGRGLKSNETSTLVWLYDDLGLDVSLILIILQLACDKNKCNIRFIESVAVDWVNRGITTLALADEEIRREAMLDKAWLVVQSAFGLEKRKPSKNEAEKSLLWINEWNISKEMLALAYDTCVNTKSKFSFAYTAKIIESWHNKGFTTPEDVQKENEENFENSSKNDFSVYDLNSFENMLKTKD